MGVKCALVFISLALLFTIGILMIILSLHFKAPRIKFQCGDFNNSALGIVGGRDVSNPTEFSFQVQLLLHGEFICGAVLINENSDLNHFDVSGLEIGTGNGTGIGLTAAHCFMKDNTTSAYSIAIGNTLVKDNEDMKNNNNKNNTEHTILQVKKFKIHPKFDFSSATNDIAIFQIQYEISPENEENETLKVSKIWIPDDNTFTDEDLEGKIATATGFGVANLIDVFTMTLPQTLKQVDLLLISHQNCSQYYGRLQNSVICAQSQKPGIRPASTCFGDSGGALFFQNCRGDGISGPIPILIGITSFGVFCPVGVFPSVFTRVQSFSKWIKETSKSFQVQVHRQGPLKSSSGQTMTNNGDGENSQMNKIVQFYPSCSTYWFNLL